MNNAAEGFTRVEATLTYMSDVEVSAGGLNAAYAAALCSAAAFVAQTRHHVKEIRVSDDRRRVTATLIVWEVDA